MNDKNYKISLSKTKQNICLSLSNHEQIIRKWYGLFAEMVYEKAINRREISISNHRIAYLNKQQVHQFFVDMTCLHQKAMFHYRIDKDLIASNFPAKHYNVAKSLLLQIRMHHMHTCKDELLAYYLNEFKTFNDQRFEHTTDLLAQNHLIQSITTKDGQRYFDKNPHPHDHIYFKHHKKLVDCPTEISLLLNSLPHTQKTRHGQNYVYHVNAQLN